MITSDNYLTAAIQASFLAELPDALRWDLVGRSRVVRVPRGHILDAEYHAFAGIVINGLLRVVGSTDNDRPVTYRNVGRGEAVGLARLVGLDDSIYVQAVTDSSVLELDLRQIAELRGRDASLALALAREVLRRLRDTSSELEVWARGSVRQRVARQLLDLAAEDRDASRTIIHINHESLADSIGSRREVVGRALASLVAVGAVRLGRGSIVILDASALRAAVRRSGAPRSEIAPARN